MNYRIEILGDCSNNRINQQDLAEAIKLKLNDDILTAEEVAEMLKTSKYVIHREIKQGEIAATKVGSKWRIPKDRLIHDLGWVKLLQAIKYLGEK